MCALLLRSPTRPSHSDNQVNMRRRGNRQDLWELTELTQANRVAKRPGKFLGRPFFFGGGGFHPLEIHRNKNYLIDRLTN
jgi:hypothetical protein